MSNIHEVWLRQLLEEDKEYENEISDKAESYAEDHVEVQNVGSSSEEEFESSDLPIENVTDFYIGKDKTTKWHIHPHCRTVRIRPNNIDTQQPGVKNIAKNAKTAYDTWKLFFSNQVIDIIVMNTNKFIEQVSTNYSRERDARPTDRVEMEALLGLFLFSSVRKYNHLHSRELFRTDGSSPEIIRLAMCWTRFSFLLKCLRFDDKDTRHQRLYFDKLSPIRELFEIINSSFSKFYSASEYVTIGEKLESFRGQCSFKQHVSSNMCPNKYGLKLNALIDAQIFYILNMEVYVGEQPGGPFNVDTTPIALVDRLCDVISGTGRNVTLNNYLTSIDLANLLLEKHNLTIIGTLSKNKTEIPTEFVQGKCRAEGSSLFGFQKNCTLVSYVDKKGKTLLLISTLHHDDTVDPSKNEPEIISTYKSTKGGIETVDQLCSTYNCARRTNRWPMVLFYSLMNVSAINAFIIYTENNCDSILLRNMFLVKLSYELMEKHLKKRAYCKSLPRFVRERLSEICGLDPKESNLDEYATPGRCVYCGSKKNRKTKYNCQRCKKYFCLQHAKMLCEDCYVQNVENV